MTIIWARHRRQNWWSIWGGGNLDGNVVDLESGMDALHAEGLAVEQLHICELGKNEARHKNAINSGGGFAMGIAKCLSGNRCSPCVCQSQTKIENKFLEQSAVLTFHLGTIPADCAIGHVLVSAIDGGESDSAIPISTEDGCCS